jgi:UDP-3-O-acyl-N-acetylglucosamine deacetylase
MSQSPLDVQVAGDHYKSLAIQPVEYIHANQIPFIEGSVIKYVTRWKSKGGINDLQKAKHFIELLIELETREGIANKVQSTPKKETSQTSTTGQFNPIDHF